MREIGVALLAATVVMLALTAPPADAAPAPGRGPRGDRAHRRRSWSAAMRPRALNAEPAERYAVFRQLPPEQLQGLQILKRELAERNAVGDHPRVEILGLGGAWQNASMVLADRGHHRLQPAAARRLRARHRPRRECRRPEPAHVPGHLPRLQMPARRPARPRIPGSRPPDRAHAAPFPPPERRRGRLRHRQDVGLSPQRLEPPRLSGAPRDAG